MADVMDTAALEELRNTETRTLLDTVDSLRSLGVGEIVNLPQIVVVGDQSAGKSSVLEAISHVNFPTKGGLCTRFATEVILRSADETQVKVSVCFADSSRSSHNFQKTGLSKDDLPDIIEEAKAVMGIRKGSSRGFSKDKLRLEIEGPGIYPLTLVDLPGFFHSETTEQSVEDKRIVDNLTDDYMKRENTIILAVVSANNQLANQIVLSKAIEHDPERRRTLGVITKPDLPRPGSADEKKYLQVARGHEQTHKLALGWHVLRNRAEDEDTLDDRDAAEKRFFASGAWASIQPIHRGIQSLRQKLSRVLFEHVRQNLPDVVSDIETNLQLRQRELDRLGNARSTPDEMRSYLLRIAEDFQRIASAGVEGRYNDSFFGTLEEDDRKLRAQLRNFSRGFEFLISRKGAAQKIVDEDLRSTAVDEEEDEMPDFLQEFLQRFSYDSEDPEVITTEDLNEELIQMAAINRGREFPGSPNSDLVIQLFKRQAKPWKGITSMHLGNVELVGKKFVEELFQHLVGSQDLGSTWEAILSICVDPFFEERHQELLAKLDELLLPYTQGFGLPLAEEFRQRLSKRTANRLTSRVKSFLREEHPDAFGSNQKSDLSLNKILQAVGEDEDFAGNEFGTEKVISMMEAYYEMSLRTFMDNVTNLAVESCLVSKIPSILTPTLVDQMSYERLAELASEPLELQSKRQHLQQDVGMLREGLDKCRRYRPRQKTSLGANTASATLPKTKAPVTESPSTPPRHSSSSSQLTPPSSNGITSNKTVPPGQVLTPIHQQALPTTSLFDLTESLSKLSVSAKPHTGRGEEPSTPSSKSRSGRKVRVRLSPSNPAPKSAFEGFFASTNTTPGKVFATGRLTSTKTPSPSAAKPVSVSESAAANPNAFSEFRNSNYPPGPQPQGLFGSGNGLFSTSGNPTG